MAEKTEVARLKAELERAQETIPERDAEIKRLKEGLSDIRKRAVKAYKSLGRGSCESRE